MFELFHHPFMVRALLTGMLLGALLGVIGVFMVLRGMAFLSDTLAHVSLTGYALGVLMGVAPSMTAICFGILVGIGILQLRRRLRFQFDTSIGIFFSSGLAIGVLLVTALQDRGYTIGLHDLLFGQILGVTWGDVVLVACCTVLGLTGSLVLARPVLQVSFNPELAQVHGVKVDRVETLFMVLVAVSVGLAVQVVGALLVGALLLIPAASAKLLARSFVQMVFLAGAAGVLSAFGGMWASFSLDAPPGPTLVLTALALFLLATILRWWRLSQAPHPGGIG